MNNVTDILQVIDDHGFLDTDTNTKLAFLNDAITDFCSRELWPFLEADPVTLTFDGTNPYPTNLPTNFQTVISIVDPVTGRVILPNRVDTLEKQAAQLMTQLGPDPLYYYFDGNKLKFASIPPASFTARMRYIQYHPEVTSSTDSTGFLIPKRFWMALVFGTLIRLYDLDDDPQMSARYEQHLETRIASIRASLWQRQVDQPDAVTITDPDYLIDFPL